MAVHRDAESRERAGADVSTAITGASTNLVVAEVHSGRTVPVDR
jgi:hypothetical protein